MARPFAFGLILFLCLTQTLTLSTGGSGGSRSSGGGGGFRSGGSSGSSSRISSSSSSISRSSTSSSRPIAPSTKPLMLTIRPSSPAKPTTRSPSSPVSTRPSVKSPTSSMRPVSSSPVSTRPRTSSVKPPTFSTRPVSTPPVSMRPSKPSASSVKPKIPSMRPVSSPKPTNMPTNQNLKPNKPIANPISRPTQKPTINPTHRPTNPAHTPRPASLAPMTSRPNGAHTPSNVYQVNPAWKNLQLGNGKTTIGKGGCAVSSLAAMAEKAGIKINGATPNTLNMNNWLKANGGFAQGSSSVNMGAMAKLGLRAGDPIAGSNKAAILQGMSQGKSAILNVGGHYVYATGSDATGFTVVDPGHQFRNHYRFDQVKSARMFSR